MKTLKSPLELKNFAIISSSIDFDIDAFPNQLNKDLALNNVDIDFDILRSSNKSDFKIQMRIRINEKLLNGYKIDVSSIGFFSINDITDENVIAGLINFSALNICIANLRSFIANITSYYPLGQYMFHSIDMNALVKEKQKKIKSKVNKQSK